MFLPVFNNTHDHEDEDAQDHELQNDAQQRGQPSVHPMQNEADDGHQENGWNKQERNEAEVEFRPLPQTSAWANPILHAQDEMTQALSGTNHRI